MGYYKYTWQNAVGDQVVSLGLGGEAPDGAVEISQDEFEEAQNRLPDAPQTKVPDISRRQFYEQLAIDGEITEDEALDAAAGIALPKLMSDAISALPTDQQFSAKMLLRTATSFDRTHPLVEVLGNVLKKDSAALDTLWAQASAL